MKKIFAILIAAFILLSLIGCEEYPEVPDTVVTTSPDKPEEEVNLTGIWEYEDLDAYLLIFEDMGWKIVFNITETTVAGTCQYTDSKDIKLLSNETDEEFFDMLVLHDENGKLLPDGVVYSENYGSMTFFCSFGDEEHKDLIDFLMGNVIPTPYFEEMGYKINYELGEGGFYKKNVGYAFTENGKHYGRIPTTVTIKEKSFNDTKDGYVEIEILKTVYFDVGDYPDFMFSNKFTIGHSTNIYDYYTGYWLRGTPSYGDTSRGDNYFFYEYESQGRQVKIEYNFSTKWTRHNDTSYTLDMEFFFRMPADYDGIIMGIPEAYANYKAYQASLTDPGDTLEIIEDSVAEKALFCRIHTLG